MDIWTEQLQKRHLPILESWLGRSAGALTPNDLPKEGNQLSSWFNQRLGSDFLISVYETPVGVAGLRDNEFYLFLGEVGYNLARTATYATLRILDQAFTIFDSATVRVHGFHPHPDPVPGRGALQLPFRSARDRRRRRMGTQQECLTKQAGGG